jgi:CheY-like chemotaxis protein
VAHGTGELPELSGLRALVVDDNRKSLIALRDYLAAAGLEVSAADSGSEALAMLHRASLAGRGYQFVLIDADMPEQDGWALLEELRRDEALQPCTATMLLPPIQQSERIGADDFADVHCVPKPAKHSELIDAALRAAKLLQIGSDGPAEEAISPATQSLKVLLVEDGIVNQQVATGLLELLGHQSQVANNGLEALAGLEREEFDVVFMDLEMPEMDGLTAAAEIRKREQTSGARIPIIAMTAHAVKGFAEQCLAAGMDSYITKPIWPDDLKKALELATRLGSERSAVNA